MADYYHAFWVDDCRLIHKKVNTDWVEILVRDLNKSFGDAENVQRAFKDKRVIVLRNGQEVEVKVKQTKIIEELEFE